MSPIQREFKPLSLIHSYLTNTKQITIRKDDFSRYTKVYLIRLNIGAFDMFLTYNVVVKNQLKKKIKRIRSHKDDGYTLFNDFYRKEWIIHVVVLPYSLELIE
ncbi:hypothetical protein CR513_21546, partial [Mucuna pruriens]